MWAVMQLRQECAAQQQRLDAAGAELAQERSAHRRDMRRKNKELAETQVVAPANPRSSCRTVSVGGTPLENCIGYDAALAFAIFNVCAWDYMRLRNQCMCVSDKSPEACYRASAGGSGAAEGASAGIACEVPRSMRAG